LPSCFNSSPACSMHGYKTFKTALHVCATVQVHWTPTACSAKLHPRPGLAPSSLLFITPIKQVHTVTCIVHLRLCATACHALLQP
jgi:hypothetical protein